MGFEIVDATVTRTLSFLNISVLKTHIEDGQADAWHLISWEGAGSQLINKWLNI
ncbi:MAG: hypothetical protein OEV89_07665 [Desulfobulbaceae bacterium]|nr:hypothetical protein [Desulfobulbaceae bacterium]